ncbi:MAG: Asp-tRNA(Asn)/Glu-tRNA(Gln) amidotransferase GatCAB subunit B, partial [Planctomycetaceae bacterium]
ENGETIPTPIVEIKNLNSIRGVEAAIEYQVRQQVKSWQKDRRRMGEVPKTTVGWDAGRNATFEQRGKEEAADYRYFPDPDLCPVTMTREEVDVIRSTICELPAARRGRYVSELGLTPYDSGVIVDQGAEFAAYFDEVARICGDGKQAANWVTQDVQRELNERKLQIGVFPVAADVLGTLLQKIVSEAITGRSGREVFEILLQAADDGVSVGPDRIDEMITEKGLGKEQDSGRIDAVIQMVLDRNAAVVEDVRNGRMQAVGPLIGQVMRELKGADAKEVRQMILKRIQG